MKNIRPSGKINEAKKTNLSRYITNIYTEYKTNQLVEEIYNMSNIINFMMDEGIMTREGKFKKGLTIEDILDGIKHFNSVGWNNIEEAEGTFEDLKSACRELARR